MAQPRGRQEGGGPSEVDGAPLHPADDVVGRGPELAHLLRWFRDDGATFLLVEGSPGQGKTTVWQAAIDTLRAQGVAVLASAPTEAEWRLSYSGLADLLAGELATVVDALPAPQARALAVALRLEDPGDRPIDETAVARGAIEAFRALARRRGRITVAIDDLRWLDPPSLAAIVYACRRLQPADGVRVLATHRAGEPEPAGFGRIAPVERLSLGPVSVGGIHRIVRRHVGLSLPRPRLLEIHAMAMGNPLHAIELARASAAGIAPDDGSLASLFAARLAALPPPPRDALVLVAVSADRSIARLTAAWSAMSRGGFRQAIEPALAAGLIAVAGGQVVPAHPLVTHVADQTAEPDARRAAHRALAATAVDDEERALHLGESIDGPDADGADLIEAAARSTRARGVRARSAALFERAARATPPDRVEQAGRRWIDAATAWFDAGDTHRVEDLLGPLIEAWPPGSHRAEARWRLGIALDEAGRWQEATDLWTSAIRDADDPALASQIQCSLAITAMYTDSMSAAIDWATAAVADAERSGARAALATSLAVNAFLLAMAARAGGERLMDRALAIEREIDEPLGEWSPAALAAEVARHTGDIPAALRHYEVVLERATSRGDANVEQWAAFGLATSAILAGRIALASELADLVLDIADQTDVMRIPARSLRAHVDACLGRTDAAWASLAEAMAMARAGDESAHLFGVYVVLGTIETCAGDVAAASRAYREARALADELGFAHATVLRADLLEIEAAAAAGDLEQAAEAAAHFDRLAGEHLPSWTIPLRQRADGALLAANGRIDEAIGELEAAVAGEGALPPDVGRALLALTVALRRGRRYRRARETGAAARAVFVELGMPPFVAMADREVARIPGRRLADGAGLTAAERRIAELVAAGKTNREVAAELVLSVKTVEVTLTRVYEKLGVTSRTALAAGFRESGAKV